MTEKNYISLNELFDKYKKDPEFIKEVFRNRPYFDIMLQIINLRDERNLTQQELAKRAGMHQSRISKIESAKYDIRLSTLIKIAEALDSTITINFVPSWNENQDGYEEITEVIATVSEENYEFENIRTENTIEYTCE